jgi:ATP phosphoribosyltransferase regulatory subunit
MRDLLPAEASDQVELSRCLIETFALHGYEQVMLPMFEYGAVLERGLGALVDDELLRFIEPETGSVVVLRPDMTAQIARILGTRLADAPGPARLSYQGNIVRRQHERARHERQIPQAGIELVGAGGIEADLEVLGVAVAAVRRAGLEDFTIDLGHAGIAGALLGDLDADARSGIVEALGVRDVSELTRRAEAQGLRGPELHALAELPALHGSNGIWASAERALGQTRARAGLEELRQLVDALERAELAPRLVVDLAETRDLAYYTGPVFQIHAAGPGRSVGSGGRYDGLCARFGRSRPAAGFAFGLDELEWALSVAKRPRQKKPRLLVLGDDSAVLAALRSCRVACAVAPRADALAYARAWRYTHLVEVTLNTATLIGVEDEERQALPRDPRALGAAAAALLERASGSE